MRRGSHIIYGCERQRDAKSSSATDSHPKESTKQWKQFASIGESSLSRTQFSFAKEGGSCLRMSAPSLCPSQTLHWKSVSPFPLRHGPRFPGNILPFDSLLSPDLQPCMLPSLWEFPRLPTLKLNLQSGTCWQASLASSCVRYIQPSSGYIKLCKSKVEWTVWLQNSVSLSSSLSVGWPALGSLISTHCHEPLMWNSFDRQDFIFLLPYCQSCITEFLQPENCIPSPLPIFKGISLADYVHIRHQNT